MRNLTRLPVPGTGNWAKGRHFITFFASLRSSSVQNHEISRFKNLLKKLYKLMNEITKFNKFFINSSKFNTIFVSKFLNEMNSCEKVEENTPKNFKITYHF